MYPADRKYTDDHIWISIEGSQATVGLTDHVKKNLCPVVAVDLPEVGRSIERQKPFATLESAKAVSEMFAPLTGKVVAVNTELRTHPEQLCEDSSATWIIKLEITNAAEVSKLLSNDQYAKIAAPPGKPKAPPKKPPQNIKRKSPPKPQQRPLVIKPPDKAEGDDLIAAMWTTRLRDTRLRWEEQPLSDRDYSGGSYFAWREREIILARDQRFVWRDSSFSRVSSGTRSSSVPTQKQYRGTWKITIVAGSPRLVFEDSERGVMTFRLERRSGRLLLDSQTYGWSRL
jgi:glycine cleavage system H protein